MISTPPSAILVGDLHIRDSQPICRLDNFWATQTRKFLWLRELWDECGHPPVLQPGDIFDKWKSSPQCITTALSALPPMITIPGNHDLPAGNLTEYGKSSLRCLEAGYRGEEWGWVVLGNTPHWGFKTSRNFAIEGQPWGKTGLESGVKFGNFTSPVTHVLLAHIEVTSLPNIMNWKSAIDVLDTWPGYQLIVTGHNHQSFIEKSGDRILVNPGSFTRQSVSEDHQPVVYLWWHDTNKLEAIPVPCEPYDNVMTREHITTKEETDTRIAKFVSSLPKIQGRMEVSFRKNAERLMPELDEETRQRAREMIYD